MDLMTLLGDAYKENMTLDEINIALSGRDMIDRSELNANFVSKKLFDKTASQLAEEKRKNGAQRTAADDLTAVQYKDQVGVFHRADALGYDDRRGMV